MRQRPPLPNTHTSPRQLWVQKRLGLPRGLRGARTWGPRRTQPSAQSLRYCTPPGSGLQSCRGHRAHRRPTAKATLRARATPGTEHPRDRDPTGPAAPGPAGSRPRKTPPTSGHPALPAPGSPSPGLAGLTKAPALLEGLLGRHGARGSQVRRSGSGDDHFPCVCLSPQPSQVTLGASPRVGPRAAPREAMTGVAEARRRACTRPRLGPAPAPATLGARWALAGRSPLLTACVGRALVRRSLADFIPLQSLHDPAGVPMSAPLPLYLTFLNSTTHTQTQITKN